MLDFSVFAYWLLGWLVANKKSKLAPLFLVYAVLFVRLFFVVGAFLHVFKFVSLDGSSRSWCVQCSLPSLQCHHKQMSPRQIRFRTFATFAFLMAPRFAHSGYNNKENSIPHHFYFWAPTNVATSDYVLHFSNVLLLHFSLEQDLYKMDESCLPQTTDSAGCFPFP